MEKTSEALNVFEALEKEGLPYLIIGGMASVLYGVERATFDIDIAIAPLSSDIKRLLELLKRLGYTKVTDVQSSKFIAGIDEIGEDEILERESVRIVNGQAVDLLVVPIDTFEFIWQYRVRVPYKGTTISIPSLLDLIHLKELAGRPIDLEDAKRLRHILRTKGAANKKRSNKKR